MIFIISCNKNHDKKQNQYYNYFINEEYKIGYAKISQPYLSFLNNNFKIKKIEKYEIENNKEKLFQTEEYEYNEKGMLVKPKLYANCFNIDNDGNIKLSPIVPHGYYIFKDINN